jgi:TolA-binding protein
MRSDLSELVAAYRAENPGTSLDARALRERVLAASWRRRRRRLRRAVWLLPIAAVLVGSGALAASAPARERVSRVLERLGVIAPVTASLAPALSRHTALHRAGAAPGESTSTGVTPMSSTTDVTAASATSPVSPPHDSPSSASPVAAEPTSLGSPRGASFTARHASSVQSNARQPRPNAGAPPDADTALGARVADLHGDGTSSAAESAPLGTNHLGATTKIPAPGALAADIASYHVAHELHFVRLDYAGALAAWNGYLTRFPRGTFVPEARLNRAVCLARLGEATQARAALRALADSRDEYTRTRARRLLAAFSGSR